MKLLIVGQGKGAWEIRGVQLGKALGARVVTAATPADFAWADQVILVKRGGMSAVAECHLRGIPIVWDALDFWAQPIENGIREDAAAARLQQQVTFIKPRVTVGATRAMAEACAGAYLPHHSWPGLEPADARPDLRTVAYQGNPAYLGAWLNRLAAICLTHGWIFEVNPVDLRTADVLVALREGPWDGWICRQWKSGVKLVNALAAGRPILTQRTAAWEEIHGPGSIVETAEELEEALLAWRDPERRQAAATTCATFAPMYRVEAIAERYRLMLRDDRGVDHV